MDIRILRNTKTDRYTLVNDEKGTYDSINYEGAQTVKRLFQIKVENLDAEQSKQVRKELKAKQCR